MKQQIMKIIGVFILILTSIVLVNAAPTLTVIGFDSDGISMSGNATEGYVLDTFNIASTDHTIQFTAGTNSDETLQSNYFPFILINTTANISDIKAYYDARGVPEPFLSYLKDATEGNKPFVYIDGSTIKLIDAAKHDILFSDVDMTIPDNFPLGTYTVQGTIINSTGDGNSTITFTINIIGDRVSPVITQSDMVIEATNPLGATASFPLSATDDKDGIILVDCTSTSGSMFSLGNTSVYCNGSDSHGNTANVTFNIEVKDTTSPNITAQADIVLEATNSSGAIANFTITAMDAVDGITLVNCSQDTDTLFPFGSTLVICNSSDSRNNFAQINFTVSVYDTIAPITIDDLFLGWQTSFFNITLLATDNVSGIASTNYCINETDGCTPNINSTHIEIYFDGIYYLKYQSEDNVGNIESIVNKTVLVDTTTPITTDNAPTGWQTSFFNITLLATDNVSGIASTNYCINETDGCTPNINSTNIDINFEGIYYLLFQSTDNAGNIELATNKTVYIDTIAPSTIDDALTGWYTNTVNITLVPYDATSNISTTQYCTDQNNNCTPNGNGTNITINTDGTNYIRYQSTDNAGNTENTKNKTILLDTIAPNTTDNAPTGWQTSAVNITLFPYDATSNISTTQYCTDQNNNCTPSGNGTEIIINTDGTNYIRYQSIDNAGNTENITNKTILLDATAPITTDDVPLGWINHTINVTLNASDLTGINWTKYCIDTTNNCTPNITKTNVTVINISTQGIKYIRYRSADILGNIENIKNTQILIDLTVPITTANNSGWKNNNVSVMLTASDILSGINFTQYCTNITNSCTPNINITNISSIQFNYSIEGSYYIRYRSIDNVNNTEAIKSTFIGIDKNVPITTDNAPTGWQNKDVNITLTAGDTRSGVAWTRYCIDRTNTCTPGTTGTTIIVNLEGTSYVRYRSSDNAGNQNSIQSRTIKIDKTAPRLKVISPNISVYNTTSIDLNFTVSETLPGTNSSGVNSCWYVLDNILTQNITGCNNMTLLNLSETPHSIVVYTKDNVSNINTSQIISFAVGLSQPAPLMANLSNITINNTNDTMIVLPYGFSMENINVTSDIPEYNFTTVNMIVSTNTTSMGRYINLSKDLTLSRNTSTRYYSVTIFAGTVISAPQDWDGTLVVPTSIPTSGMSPVVDAGMLPSIFGGVELGNNNSSLTLDHAARIVITGYAGQMVGYSKDGKFTKIISNCLTDTQAYGDALPEYSECKIDASNGKDLIIWTKHFTSFVVYTQHAIPPTIVTKSGGSSRLVLECSEWNECIDGKQTRTCAVNNSIKYPLERVCTSKIVANTESNNQNTANPTINLGPTVSDTKTDSEKDNLRNGITGGVVTDIEPLSIKNWMSILLVIETTIIITALILMAITKIHKRKLEKKRLDI